VAKTAEALAIGRAGRQPGFFEKIACEPVDVIAFAFDQQGAAGLARNLREPRAKQVERSRIEVLDHAQASSRTQFIHRIKDGGFRTEEQYTRGQRCRRRKQVQFGFRHDAQRSLRTDKEVEVIGAGSQEIAGGIFRSGRRGHGRQFERRLVTAAQRQALTRCQQNARRSDVPARRAVEKAAGTAGIGGDWSAHGSAVLGRIGRIELAGLRSGGLKIAQQNTRATDGESGVDFAGGKTAPWI